MVCVCARACARGVACGVGVSPSLSETCRWESTGLHTSGLEALPAADETAWRWVLCRLGGEGETGGGQHLPQNLYEHGKEDLRGLLAAGRAGSGWWRGGGGGLLSLETQDGPGSLGER